MSHKITLLLGRPTAGLDLQGALRGTLEGAPERARVRLGFPYVSNAGLDLLLSEVNRDDVWRWANKEWIVGVHHGITEPAALERLCELDRSVTRIFVGGRTLRKDSLVSGRQFHAKVICVDTSREGPKTLIAGSANLTSSAVGPNAINYEAGVWLGRGVVSQPEGTGFEAWWREAWSQSISVTEQVLRDYTSLRDAFHERNPDTLIDVDPPSIDRLDEATTLWIEAGAMSGGSRNQIEFSRELVRFFGRVVKRRRFLHIESNGRLFSDRPLTPKTTSFGVNIWRLSLPTRAQCQLAYPGNIVRFQKKRDRQGRLIFELDTAATGSPEHVAWRSSAHSRGYVGITSGAGRRTYGFY